MFAAVVWCLAPMMPAWEQDELPNRVLAARVHDDTCIESWTYYGLRWYAELVEGHDCATVALLWPGATPDLSLAEYAAMARPVLGG